MWSANDAITSIEHENILPLWNALRENVNLFDGSAAGLEVGVGQADHEDGEDHGEDQVHLQEGGQPGKVAPLGESRRQLNGTEAQVSFVSAYRHWVNDYISSNLFRL